MKSKWFLVSLSVILSLFLITGCGSNDANGEANGAEPQNDTTETENVENTANEEDDEATGKYEDGIYFAMQDEFSEKSGWKDTVVVTVENGQIIDAEWNSVHKEGGLDKRTSSEIGEYGMVEKGGAIAEWHEQAELTEQYLIETQDPTGIEWDDEGKTDAIAGVTQTVSTFFELVEKALAEGPVEKGPYEDGGYYAEADEFGKTGWKDTVSLTVINGNIVSAYWNAVHEDGGDDKKTQSINGEYGMVEKGDAIAEWHEQAELAEQYLLETQDPTAIEWNDEGKTDAISGVTMVVSSFFELAQKALEEGKLQ